MMHCHRFHPAPTTRRAMLRRCANGFGAVAVTAAFSRLPTPDERAAALAFGQEQGSADDPRVWADLAHVLVNVKEFVFVH